MWYLILAVAIRMCIYTVSYGVWEWKRNNKPACVAVCAFSLIAVAIPAINIFV